MHIGSQGGYFAPGQLLSGVGVELWTSGRGVKVAETVTAPDGSYLFEHLEPARFVVRPVQGTPTDDVYICRGLYTTTADVDLGSGSLDVSPIGPAWNFSNNELGQVGPADFVFLWRNNTIIGSVVDALGRPLPGVNVTLRHCLSIAEGAIAGEPGSCLAYSGQVLNLLTSERGEFYFSDLIEGRWEISPWVPGQSERPEWKRLLKLSGHRSVLPITLTLM